MTIKVDREAIWLDFPGSTREEIIQGICLKLRELGKTADAESLLGDVMHREELVSTFAGHGTAIPHVVTKHICAPVLCFVRAADPDLTWHGSSESVVFVAFCAVPENEGTSAIRADQSRIFSALAHLIRTPVVTDRWKATSDAAVIQEDLNQALI
ncbi:PTS sugar transporter subunit IIA [uncultured Cohaesibacter sp.]|uniref:PTS sugar transporter subunit IIA n=1 Tax=uncultured Cohaesibacter sp. TaxID=1002546 RepID=UPI00292DAC12|nr:PTS sugar transporter subunit IIA [uncultured Cohaesibacter sp.]